MDTSDLSLDNTSSSDEEIHYSRATEKTMRLRVRPQKSYRGQDTAANDINTTSNENNITTTNHLVNQNSLQNQSDNNNEDLIDEELPIAGDNYYYEEHSIFYPDIDVLLWRRQKPDSNPPTYQYLVKYKDYSYLHTEWIDEADILQSGKSAKNKVNRFNKQFDKKLLEQEIDTDTLTGEPRFFDPSYLEVDRIIHTTELFPVIHPKKANEIKGKWSESLVNVTSKLLNFTKDNVHYGVYFMDPVDPDRDGVPNYKKIIQTPIDLGTILNRIFLDYYKNSHQFWNDIGLVFKNCRKFNLDETSDIRILCDTIRELAIDLYKQWYDITSDKYEKMMADFKEKYPDFSMNKAEPNPTEEKDEIKRSTERDIKLRENDIQNILKQFEEYSSQLGNIQPQGISQQIQQFLQTKPFLANCNKTLLEDMDLNNQKIPIDIDQVTNSEYIIDLFQQYQLTPPGSLHGSIIQQQIVTQLKPEQSINQSNKTQKTQEATNIHQDNMNLRNSDKSDSKQQSMNSVMQTSLAITLKEIEQWNPGQYSYQWLIDDKAVISVEEENKIYFTEEELKEQDLTREPDVLYLVKWKNLSYLDATWEHESVIACPQKINDFKIFNRALDKETRTQMIQQSQRHKTYLEILQNPKKRAKITTSQINDIKNKLYSYDVAQHRKLFQYTPKNQPIYKDRKLLRDYQLASLNWLIQSWYQKRNTILADEMGLGKTIQSIAFLNHLITFEKVKGPFLVLAPLSTLEHWKRTTEDWTNLNGVLYYDTNSIEGRQAIRAYEQFYIDISTKGNVLQTAEIYKFQILITSYEVFLQDLNNVFLQIPFQFIVVDEAHRLKNQNAKILTSLKKLPCKRILLLTGTPIQNNTIELWTLLNYIEPEKFNSLQNFLQHFGDLSNAEQVEKLHELLKPYLLRRMKEDVESSIPPLMETIIDIEMTTIQKTIYRAIYERNKAILKGFSGSSFTTSLNNLEMQLRKCCNHPFLIKEIEQEITRECRTGEERCKKVIESSGKMILLDKLLPKLKIENKKLLIFSQFTYMLNIIEEYLVYKGYKFEKIDGTVKAKERQNSIDRFNNPEKKRDVFLLSTKAGGIGINLTSANVVVIYDSDWNPQNDVQATARAHRIGQLQEVQVYRLITAKTYEAEMFERASKKLGLDQAIFLGGAFQGQTDPKNEDIGQTGGRKMNKQELETLLKKGVLGLLDKDEEKREAFMEENIDEILKKNSRVAKYSLINGAYSFSKSTFVSQQSDANISLDDPNFWDIILKNQVSETKQLIDQLESDKNIQADIELQKQFIWKLAQNINLLLYNKINAVAFNADDEKNISHLLQKISTLKTFHRQHRDLASTWIYEIMKPSRKFKQITMNDIEVSKDKNGFKNDVPKIIIKSKNIIDKPIEDIVEVDDGEKIYNEENDDNIEAEGTQQMEESDNESAAGLDPNKSVSIKIKDELLKKLCCYCERAKSTIFCQGHCKRAFHDFCREKVDDGAICGQDNNPIYYDLDELYYDDEKIKRMMNLNYICVDCQKNLATCFKCKKKDIYIPGENGKGKSKSKSKSNNKNGQGLEDTTEAEQIMKFEKDKGKQSELIKCSTANCNKFFHLVCISNNPLFKYYDANKHKKFRCSLHYCQKCSISGDTMALAQCFRCPNAFHLKCSPKDQIIKINKKVIICPDHKIPKPTDKRDSDFFKKKKIGRDIFSNVEISQQPQSQTQFKLSGKANDSVTHIKIGKHGEMFNEEDGMLNTKIKKKTRINDKIDKKIFDKSYKSLKTLYFDVVVNQEILTSNLMAVLPSEFYLGLSTRRSDSTYRALRQSQSSFSLQSSNRESNQIKKKIDKEKLTYEDFGIDPPTDASYDNYTQDWCRYCGARYSSNFTKGPWGPRTLCTIHYIEWNQKKKLNLSNHKDLPKIPINQQANTELNYLANMKNKTNRYDNISNSELLDKVKRKKNRGKQLNTLEEEDKQSGDNKIGIKLVKKNDQFLVFKNKMDEEEPENVIDEEGEEDELEEGEIEMGSDESE